MKKIFFTGKTDQQWNWLHRQVVDSPLELSEIQLDKAVTDLIYGLWQLHFKEKAEIDDFQRFCPTNIWKL